MENGDGTYELRTDREEQANGQRRLDIILSSVHH